MIDVYKASAGSGKTYTLVQEYLKFLIGRKKAGEEKYTLNRNPDDEHCGILAVTFTNKATEEMKRRIVKELDILSRDDCESPYMDYLCRTLDAKEADIRKTCGKALRQLLHDYSNFHVSTIDAFFQLILRTFTYETELAGNYNVELNDDYAISVGISDLKRGLHKTKLSKSDIMLQQWLIDFMKSRIDEGKSWDIFRVPVEGDNGSTLYSFASALSKEAVKRHREELNEYLSDKSKIIRFKEELQKSVAVGKTAVKNAALRFRKAVEDFDESSFMRGYDKKFAMLEGDDYTTKQRDAIIATKDVPNKWFKKAVVGKLSDDKIDEINGCIGDIASVAQRIDTYKAVLSRLFNLGLLGDISANVEAFSKENNVVLLSDTNEILRRIINEDDTPFIYERIGVRLRHFLIDEFQDTSKLQWENMVPLLKNSVGNGYDNLIIGDVKQSIYRFRNSDPYLLKDDVYSRFSGFVDDKGGSVETNVNWRSSKNIVLWNNTFFSLLADKLGMSEIYGNVVQQVAKKNLDNPGHVRIEWLDADASDSGEYNEMAFSRMIADIESMLSRGYRQNDIAILVNKNDEGQAVISALLDYGKEKPENERINVVSEESLLIRKSPAVRKIVEILAFLSNGGDRNEADRFSETVDVEYVLGADTCAGLSSIVDRIVECQLSDDDRKSQTPFIQAFQDCVSDYTERYGSDMNRFLKWWSDYGRRAAISSPDNVDAVKIMTVHKSKGLEFPCVIIPICSWSYDKPQSLEWVEGSSLQGIAADIVPPILPVVRTNGGNTDFSGQFSKMHDASVLDSLNKTYVAFTRAVDELLIYVPDGKKQGIAVDLEEAVGADKNRVESVCRKAIDLVGSESLVYPAEHFDAEKKVFELGESPCNKREYKSAKPVEMPPYTVVYRPESWAFDIPDIVVENRDSIRYKGVVMHRIMCRISTKDDLAPALKYFRVKGIINDAESEEFGSIIRDGLEDARVADWFADGNIVVNERSMTDGKGATYRTDRIVTTPDGRTIVIDYKFGEKEDNKHLRQVRNYVKLLEACGKTNVEGFVWYVQEKIIKKV